MILRVKKKADSPAITVSRLLTIRGGGTDVSITADDNGIIFSDERENYNDWYSSMINKKRVAMRTGGVIEGIADFEQGIRVYTHKDDNPYILSFVGCTADSNGNIQLLPGRTLDVTPENGNIICRQIKIPKGSRRDEVLTDINRCVWYLYHTFNSFLYRMNVWDPYQRCKPMYTDARMLGVIQAYQATVAAWNLKIWRSSFLWEVAQAADSITFHIGYVALNCVNPDVQCFVTLANGAPQHSYSGSVDETTGIKLDTKVMNTTELYTLYDQGVATNKKGENSVIDATIEKILPGGANDGSNKVPVGGRGTDSAAELGQHWNTITVKIPLGKLEQGEYYRGAYALAIAHNNTTSTYYEGVDTSVKYDIKITVEWVVNNDIIYSIEEESNYISKLLLYTPEDGEEEGNFI